MKFLNQVGTLFIQQMYFIFVIFGSAFILLGSIYLLRTTRRFNKTVASLRESENNFRLLVKTIPSVVFKGYPDWSVDLFDEKFEKSTGYSIEDFNSRRMKWNELIVPEDLEKAKEIFRQALKTNKSYVREYRIKIKSGELLWVRERGQIICDADGTVEYITGIYSDITEAHEFQETIKKMQQHHETVLNSLGEGLLELDQAGEVVFVNPAVLKMLGYQARDIMGQNLHELIHHKRADGTPYPQDECLLRATLKDGQERFIIDEVFWTKKGDPLPVAYLTRPIKEDGQIVGVVATFRDITWLKKAEAELKQANQYMQNIFDNSAEAIGIVDSKGLVRKWNKASEEIYGCSFEELQGKPVFDLYANKDALANMLIQLRQDGCVKHYEIEMKKKNGTTFPCSLSVKMLRDEKNKNMGSVTIARDLTEQKENLKKLQAANEQLQILVHESDRRNRQMTLLQKMSDVFQACQSSGETYSAIANFVPQFFPDYSGALYILNNSKNLFEMTSIWGDTSSLEMVFDHDECWSLRRSRAYLVHDSATSMNCRHIGADVPGSYLCVPLMAQGEVMGIFHLRQNTPQSADQLKATGQFAVTVAEAMAMALANLKLRETLRNQAIRDGLTGLFNRRYLEETLERELSRGKRSGSPLGVIMLDLDHFKEYNDTYGHNAGDELLCALSQMIQETVRREDIACRFGGEEFLLIMPGAPMDVALDRAKALNEGVKRLYLQSSSLKAITISAGVAVFPDHGSSGKEVIQAADTALYQAKEAGRDRVVMADSRLKGRALAN